ncbi:MAG: SIR2 family protein [Candidatus Tectomicrobia bacterium]|nr:SIR2 family protein [Candidatus Tectomicrobia bacterium]
MAFPSLELPDALVAAVIDQSAVLFLGAGASFGAQHPAGAIIPSAELLKNELCDKFLGGKLKNRSLSHVAEMCISETDLLSVQSFIRDKFLPFEPADHHLIIPCFYWHAIVTTNYDLILERAYAKEKTPKQTLVPFIKDGQKIDTTLKKTIKPVPFIKLHGSIDKIDDSEIPLILSKEQYVRHSGNRKRLFSTFQQYGYEFPIIFCGYSIDDQHIQTILFDLTDSGINRPRYYVVSPDLDDVEQRYWATHRITCLRATSEDFLVALEKAIPEHKRAIPVSLGGGTESVRTFQKISGASESEGLRLFLSADVDHVRSGMATSGKEPKHFYIGADTGWRPIESDLDVRRRITDNIIVDAILADEKDRQRLVDLHVIKGPAGHGKTTTLRRVAWEASVSFSKLCLFVKEEGAIRIDQLKELWDLTQERIFLFVDRAALRVDDILSVIGSLAEAGIPLTIVTAERDNEWNVRCGTLDEFVTQEYPLRNLSEKEIHALLAKLEKHDSLGRLSDFSYQERVREFVERAERQLLVALHEATLGKPFEEIVKDEFDRIIPAEAQTLYLDVCTLNRLGVPVRAGLIARVSGIRFEDFKERFLSPLEHVVTSHIDRYVGDRMYSARHQHIADLVFQLVLPDPEDRFDQIIRILDGMNIDYSSDNEAFRALIRGRAIAEIFASQELARRFYARAEQLVGDDQHLLQQRAVFEMNHPGGSLQKAEDSLLSALGIAPHDKGIQHTLGNLKRQQANETNNPLLRDKLRRDSRGYLSDLARGDARTPHGFHTLILLLSDQLRDLLANKGEEKLDQLEERTVVELIRDIESRIREGEQRFPDDERLLTAEAAFRELLKQDGRAFEALRKAFDKNPRSEWVAIRMSQRFAENGDYDDAKGILLRCVKENPSSKAVNFALAKLYMRYGTRDEKGQVLQLLRRSFTDGDSHFDAQYWYARELFLRSACDKANELFSKLSHASVSPAARNRIRGLIRDEDGRVKRFKATVSKKEEAYLFASPEGFPKDVFCHFSQASEEIWGDLHVGSSVELEIGFSMRGPVVAAIIQV